MEQKVIAVVNAVGYRSRGLVSAALEDRDGGFRIRALVAEPDAPEAAELRAAGVEVVRAHLDEPETILRGFEGADVAYCVTDYDSHFSPEKEIEHSHMLGRVAKESKVPHAIWVTFDDIVNQDPVNVLGEADQSFVELGVPTTFLLPSFYWEMFIGNDLGPKRRKDGRLVFSMPYERAKIPGLAVEDCGRCAYGVARRGAEFVGKVVGIAGEHLTGLEMSRAFAEALGEPVEYVYLPPGVFETPEFRGADDPTNITYKVKFEKEFCALRDVARSRSLNPKLQTFREWLSRNVAHIPIRELA